MSSTKLSIVPPIIAHRGACSYAPENTLAAFSKVKELGLKWVELDVMLSACGEVVVIHDETLERTTTGKGKVCDYPYDYLKTLDAGSWFDSSFSNERIATLLQVMQLLQELNLSANIEIKSFPGEEEKTVSQVLNVLTPFAPVLISSFSRPMLQIVRNKTSRHWLGFLMDDWEADWMEFSRSLQCAVIDVNHNILTPEKVLEIKKQDFLLGAYTVNSFERAKLLFSWGVDFIFSDFPQPFRDAYILTD